MDHKQQVAKRINENAIGNCKRKRTSSQRSCTKQYGRGIKEEEVKLLI
jgi:hypothetical protein